MRPLNGTKTHPLSDHCKGILCALRAAPIPAQEINPGAWNRLQRETPAVVEGVMLSSPYKVDKGRGCLHAKITQAGRNLLDRLNL